MTASGVAAQDATSTAEPGTVVVYGEVAEPVRFTAAGLAAMERRTVTGTDHAGSGRVTYEGVPLRALLDRAGVAGDVDLRGEELLRWVVVEAADGYRVLFSLAELDPLYESAAPILADRRDGAPLPDDVGPFQIIAPEETRHARWVRQVRCLRVGRVR